MNLRTPEDDPGSQTLNLVVAVSRFQLLDTTQCIFKCPSKVQVEAVNSDDIGGEKK